MNTFLSILFPKVSRGLVGLRTTLGLTKNNTTMARLSTEEEVEIIEGAVRTIEKQKAAIAALKAQLGSLPQENADLQAALALADEADAVGDESLTALKGAVEAAESEE